MVGLFILACIVFGCIVLISMVPTFLTMALDIIIFLGVIVGAVMIVMTLTKLVVHLVKKADKEEITKDLKNLGLIFGALVLVVIFKNTVMPWLYQVTGQMIIK